MSSSNTCFFVGQVLEALEGLVQRVLAQLVAQGAQLFAESGATGVLAHHQVGAALPHILGLHDLVGAPILEHAVLMDAALVGEGVLADDRLVELNRKAGNRRNIAAGPGDVLGLDAGVVAQMVTANFQRHDDFFQRRIARPLADAVHGHLDLSSSALNTGQAVGNRQTKVIVAVGGEDHRVGILDVLDDVAKHVAIFGWIAVADGVRQVDGPGPRLDGDVHTAAQEVRLGAGGVLGGPFHIAAQVARMGNRLGDHLQDVFLAGVQDVVAVAGAGGQEGMDTAALGLSDRLGAALDIGHPGAGKAANHAR